LGFCFFFLFCVGFLAFSGGFLLGEGAGSFFFTLSFILKETSFCFELEEDHGIPLLF